MALIKCPECGKEISSSAKNCPNCGHPITKEPELKQTIIVKEKKKGSCLMKILAVVVILVVLGAVGSQSVKNGNGTGKSTGGEEQETEQIEYIKVTIDQLMDELDTNAMNAADSYKDKHLEVTGKLSTIDSSGKYISLVPDDDFAIIGIQCYIKNDEQKNAVKSMTVGDTVTVRGKCTDVGEVLGYYLDIESIG